MSFLYRFVAFAVVSQLALADSSNGLTFSHHDWSLVCDNTRTCRAIGNSSNKDKSPVSFIFMRNAGPNTPVFGQAMTGDSSYDYKNLTLRINNKNIGRLDDVQNNPYITLSDEQTSALLKSLLRKSNIEIIGSGRTYHLSDKGASAVLLKMDEFQGRIGTPGALARKGRKSEDAVLRQMPIPSMTQAPIHKALPGDKNFVNNHITALISALRNSFPAEHVCADLISKDGSEYNIKELEAVRLTEKQMLLSGLCWRDTKADYYGYWVINDSPPFDPQLITSTGQRGTRTGTIRARGQGECTGFDEWTWGGDRFVITSSVAWKICRKIGENKTWWLPTTITNVF